MIGVLVCRLFRFVVGCAALLLAVCLGVVCIARLLVVLIDCLMCCFVVGCFHWLLVSLLG